MPVAPPARCRSPAPRLAKPGLLLGPTMKLPAPDSLPSKLLAVLDGSQPGLTQFTPNVAWPENCNSENSAGVAPGVNVPLYRTLLRTSTDSSVVSSWNRIVRQRLATPVPWSTWFTTVLL